MMAVARPYVCFSVCGNTHAYDDEATYTRELHVSLCTTPRTLWQTIQNCVSSSKLVSNPAHFYLIQILGTLRRRRPRLSCKDSRRRRSSNRKTFGRVLRQEERERRCVVYITPDAVAVCRKGTAIDTLMKGRREMQEDERGFLVLVPRKSFELSPYFGTNSPQFRIIPAKLCQQQHAYKWE